MSNKQIGILIILVLFLLLNIGLMMFTENLFNNDNTKTYGEKALDGLYFSTTTLSTVGYGDISPIHWSSKTLVILEQLFLVYLSINAVGLYIDNQLNIKNGN